MRSPVETLDFIRPELERTAWRGNPSSVNEEASRDLIYSCEAIERAKYRILEIPNAYENEISSDWVSRILIGPGSSEGLGAYDRGRSLGRFVSHSMGMDAKDLKKKLHVRRASTINPEIEPRDHRRSFIDEHENYEIVQVAIEKLKTTISSGQVYLVLSALGDYHRENRSWPRYRWVAHHIGVSGNTNHICSMVKILIKKIEDKVKELI